MQICPSDIGQYELNISIALSTACPQCDPGSFNGYGNTVCYNVFDESILMSSH